ncbi:hypothetical protein STEG23_023805, partial [Scotinomys teguina]
PACEAWELMTQPLLLICLLEFPVLPGIPDRASTHLSESQMLSNIRLFCLLFEQLIIGDNSRVFPRGKGRPSPVLLAVLHTLALPVGSLENGYITSTSGFSQNDRQCSGNLSPSTSENVTQFSLPLQDAIHVYTRAFQKEKKRRKSKEIIIVDAFIGEIDGFQKC